MARERAIGGGVREGGRRIPADDAAVVGERARAAVIAEQDTAPAVETDGDDGAGGSSRQAGRGRDCDSCGQRRHRGFDAQLLRDVVSALGSGR